MAGLINLKLFTDFFNKIGPSRQAVLRLVSVAFGCIADMVGPAAGFVPVENDPSEKWQVHRSKSIPWSLRRVGSNPRVALPRLNSPPMAFGNPSVCCRLRRSGAPL